MLPQVEVPVQCVSDAQGIEVELTRVLYLSAAHVVHTVTERKCMHWYLSVCVLWGEEYLPKASM
jgi:hypothetical protein